MSDTIPWYLKTYKEMLSSTAERRLLGVIERVLLHDSAERNAQRDTVHLHPSEMAKENWCPRQSYYKITDTEVSDPDSFSFQRLNIFEEGHSIHAKWQHWMYKTGMLVGDWKCKRCSHKWWAKSPDRCPSCYEMDLVYAEIPIRNEEHMILGHADGLIEDDKGQALVEIKSVGLGTIRMDAPALYKPYSDGSIGLDELWKRIKRPLASHNRQIQLYMYCFGVHDAVVVYEWKPTQDIKEFSIKFDPNLVNGILVGAVEVISALHTKTTPDRPASATHKTCDTCKYCPYKTSCWKPV